MYTIQWSIYLSLLSSKAEFIYVESDFPNLKVMRNRCTLKIAKNVEMFQYIGVNNHGGG